MKSKYHPLVVSFLSCCFTVLSSVSLSDPRGRRQAFVFTCSQPVDIGLVILRRVKALMYLLISLFLPIFGYFFW